MKGQARDIMALQEPPIGLINTKQWFSAICMSWNELQVHEIPLLPHGWGKDSASTDFSFMGSWLSTLSINQILCFKANSGRFLNKSPCLISQSLFQSMVFGSYVVLSCSPMKVSASEVLLWATWEEQRRPCVSGFLPVPVHIAKP